MSIGLLIYSALVLLFIIGFVVISLKSNGDNKTTSGAGSPISGDGGSCGGDGGGC